MTKSIQQFLTTGDELIRNSSDRKQLWYIVRKDETTLLTSLGSVTYQKTLFKSKKDGHCEYRANHGNMLELVRYQKQELKKAAGAEYDEIGLTAGKIIAMQRKQKAALGVLEGTKIYTVLLQARKILAIIDHLLGL